MSLLEDVDISEAAQRREIFRASSVSTRLTRKETQKLDALATNRGIQRGELIRQLIRVELAKDAGEPSLDASLTEIVGLRLLLTNILRPMAIGQKITAEAFDNILAEVKKRKKKVAAETQQEAQVDA